MYKRVQQGVLWRDELVFTACLMWHGLIVAAIGTAGCQHESQAEQEEVRTVSYRAVMQSDKPVPEKVNTWLGAMSQEDKIGQLMMISLHGSTVGQSQKGCHQEIPCERALC